MIEKISDKKKTDPSDIRQIFNDISVKLLCCRYWILDEWECNDLSVPFWRVYYNQINGAKIIFNGQTYLLNEKSIIIIPPNTNFSTELNKKNKETIVGNKFNFSDSLSNIEKNKQVDHLFIHFSLGFPLDFAQLGIYTIESTPYKTILNEIKQFCYNDLMFDFHECLKIKQLIASCILSLKSNVWMYSNIDSRVFNAMQFIKKNYNNKISNEELAENANMAVNSFARLFKNSTGISIQQFVLKTKIEVSCSLMHHSNKTIDEIADECGFSDRHHFSKIFKKVMSINPAYYKKRLIMV